MEKGVNFWRPSLRMIAAADARLKGWALFEPSTSQLIKTGLAETKLTGRRSGIESTSVEIGQKAKNEFGREAMDDLFLFKAGICLNAGTPCDQKKPAWFNAQSEGKAVPSRCQLEYVTKYRIPLLLRHRE